MAPKTLHLIERAAERLREDGALDPATAQLLNPDRGAGPGAPLPAAHGRLPDAAPTPAVGRAALEAAGMIGAGRGRGRVAEEFRIAQSQVLRTAFAADAAGGRPGTLVLVTSARPGEGKSFAALNLAAGIARQNDHDVLLVDADSKPDSLGRTLGLGDAPGLLDLADAGLDPEAAIVRTEIPKLSLLPPGRAGEHGPDLFATRHMGRQLRDLGRRYADCLVVIDAPPCLASSDPSALAAIVGQIVFVIEAGRTQREEVEGALDLVQACPAITLLLNKVRANARNSFGSYAPYASRQTA